MNKSCNIYLHYVIEGTPLMHFAQFSSPQAFFGICLILNSCSIIPRYQLLGPFFTIKQVGILHWKPPTQTKNRFIKENRQVHKKHTISLALGFSYLWIHSRSITVLHLSIIMLELQNLITFLCFFLQSHSELSSLPICITALCGIFYHQNVTQYPIDLDGKAW